MKVKRYEGSSQEALMSLIRKEMGEDVTVISVKEVPKKGLLKWFGKPKVVITVACEDDAPQTQVKPVRAYPTPHIERKVLMPPIASDAALPEPGAMDESNAMEESMTLLLQEARKAAQIQAEQMDRQKSESSIQITSQDHANTKKYAHSVVQLLYDTMLSQDVLPDVAAHLLGDLQALDESTQVDIRLLIKAVYANIVDILNCPKLIEDPMESSQVIVFMGPTGVGKTTTIAKLSSILTLKHEMKVGLITADTYRIAAVEQLKTYADILGLDIRVIYTPDELPGHLKSLRARNDIVLIDTAGRSHRNEGNLQELKTLLESIPPDSKHYLVCSVTTRYNDLFKIVNTYDRYTDFNLIFTKLDEADALGSLINICCLTGKKAAYVTFGQNVPDDLEPVKPDKIAKSLLGLDGSAAQPYSEGGKT